jgi:hypothetical protein
VHQTFDDVELYDAHRAGDCCAAPSTLMTLGMGEEQGRDLGQAHGPAPAGV